MEQGATGPPAGWYPDPEGGANPRYWDGQAWTEQYMESAGHRLANPADPPQRLRPLQIVAVVVLVIVALVELNNIGADGEYIDLANEIIDGGQPSNAEIRDAEDRVDQASIALLVAYIIAAVGYIPWFQRAYSNLPRMGVSGLRFGTGWAVGAWFVPILNLVRPKMIANDIDRASAPDALVATGAWHQRSPAALLHWWWGLFLLGNFLANFAVRAIIGSAEQDVLRDPSEALDALERERNGFSLDIIASLISIVAVVLAILVVRRITRRQDAVIDKLEAEAALSGPTIPT